MPTTPITMPRPGRHYSPRHTNQTTIPDIPDVWDEPSTEMEWCDCGCHCPLTKTVVREFARDVLGLRLPARVIRRQVIEICMVLWHYEKVCRFFTLSVEDAAVRVNGKVAFGLLVGHRTGHRQSVL